MERGVKEVGDVPLERAFLPSSCDSLLVLCNSSVGCANAYQGGDGAAVGRDTLGGKVDTVGGLELDLKGSWERVSACL